MSTNVLNADSLIGSFGRNWATAFAIAMAESGGNPTLTSPNPDGGTNVGLFQIDTNTARAYHLDPNRLAEPAYNIHAASIISNRGKGWHQWATAYANPHDPSTYFSDKAPFRKFLKRAGFSKGQTAGNVDPVQNAFGLPTVHNPVPGLPHIANPLTWAKALTKLLGLLLEPKTWLRVVEVIGALALGWFALKQLAATGSSANA